MRLVFGLIAIFYSVQTWSNPLRFDELAVQWQPEERWLWQGQALSSQQFSSQQDVMTIAQQIQQLVHQQGMDVRLQRLSSAWLLSFEENQSQQHYLFMLSANPNGTTGWLSTLQLPHQEVVDPLIMTLPQAVFKGMYQHGWSLQVDAPVYTLLQPRSPSPQLWQRLQNRLMQQHWEGGFCEQGHWCQWHKDTQKLWLWADNQQGLWHVLWWPKSS